MKLFKLILLTVVILLIKPLEGDSNTAPTLNDCFRLAKMNYPKLKQIELKQKISGLNQENILNAYLPEFNLKGQATWQSDVTSIDLEMTGITFDEMSKDQYKLYVEFRQNIWDGGMSTKQKALEEGRLQSELYQLDVEFYQIKNWVSEWYFNILMLDKSCEVLLAKTDLLDHQLKQMNASFREGFVLENNLDKLKAEKLLVQQNVDDLLAKRKAVIDALSLTIGKTISADDDFALPVVGMLLEAELKRPEMQLLDQQKKQLETSKLLLSSGRNPKFFSFGQAGYGRPGLNMLSNDFEPYMLIGVGFSWNIWDKGLSKRKKHILNLQSRSIDVMEQDFLRNQKLQLDQFSSDVKRINHLIVSDKELFGLRERIAKRSSSALKNGSITATEYLMDLNAQSLANIQLEQHQLELLKAIVKYNIALGE